MLRGINRWGLGYLRSVLRRESFAGKLHLLVCVADHFEPFDRTILPDGSVTGGVSDGVARGFVKEWCSDYRKALGEFRDADGVAPRHTFFYPWDEYDAGCLDELGLFCRDGFGEVEIHLHHRNDSEEGVRQKLIACRDTFAGEHGLLGERRTQNDERGMGMGKQGEVGLSRSLKLAVRDEGISAPESERGSGENAGGMESNIEHRTSNIHHRMSDDEGRKTKNEGRKTKNEGQMTKDQGQMTKDQGQRAKDYEPAYSFVHGNWCLCNGRADGDWCGVDRELAVLAETGCYADLTFPSAPSATQTRSVNEIYYGRDPRDGERGVQRGGGVECDRRSEVGGQREKWGLRTKNQERRMESGVVMIPGPLGLNFGRRKFGVLPGLENGEISGVNPATVERMRLWRRIGVHVSGRPEWVVIKLHTHGAVRGNRDALLGEQMVVFHRELAEMCGDESDLCLHYVSARELFNIIKAAEGGFDGDPGQYRNFSVTANNQVVL